MARKDQVLVLAVRFDDEAGAPEEWPWPELLACDPKDVKVIMAGPVTDPGEALINP